MKTIEPLKHFAPGNAIWDVVVIGAGPAGSASAIGAARLGYKTLLIDAKSFPRRKVCGGCMNLVAIDHLQQLIGGDHSLWQRASPISMYQLIHRKQRFQFDLPGGMAIERSDLDNVLLEEAVRAGVTFQAPATAYVESVDEHGVQVGVRVQNQQLGPLRAQAVVVAGGLNCTAVASLPELRTRVARRSRVGIAATLSDVPRDYAQPGIYMAVDRAGYVGLTKVANNQLHLAAAVDVEGLQRLGPQRLAAELLANAGAPDIDLAKSVSWRGTPPLTARSARFAYQRVFLVGDAAGYVEPFTGEGIRWALATGREVPRFIDQLVRHSSTAAAFEWDRWYRRNIARDQWMCRSITWAIRSHGLRWMAHHLLNWRPEFAQPIINSLNANAPISRATPVGLS